MKIKKNNEIDFKGQDIFTGIDMHKKNWKVNILVGEIDHKTFTMDPFPKILINYFKTHFPNANYHTVYEAGYSGFHAHYELVENGINSIVVHPADVPTTDKEKRGKNDTRDCRKLAQSLRSGLLTPIFIPSKENNQIRRLIRGREKTVWKQTRIKNQIKAEINFLGFRNPVKSKWSAKYINWLKQIEYANETGRKYLDHLIEELKYYTSQISQMEKSMTELSKSEYYSENYKLLTTIPGIGLITAMTILSEIENINRFKYLDNLASYFGLVPSDHSSGGKTITGRLNGRGNKILKYYLIEAAWSSLRKDPALMKSFLKYRNRMEPQEAIIRIARKLLNRIMFVLKNKKKYVLMVN